MNQASKETIVMIILRAIICRCCEIGSRSLPAWKCVSKPTLASILRTERTCLELVHTSPGICSRKTDLRLKTYV